MSPGRSGELPIKGEEGLYYSRKNQQYINQYINFVNNSVLGCPYVVGTPPMTCVFVI